MRKILIVRLFFYYCSKVDTREYIVDEEKTNVHSGIPDTLFSNHIIRVLSTPVGLQEWFADKVDQRDTTYYFSWNGSTDTAELVEAIENEYVVYRWDYYDDEEFFEFRIEQSPITNETILKITDFADKVDLKDQERLWNSQVADLKHRIGA